MNTENFTGKAEAYALGRPGYPKEAIDYICSLVPRDAVFADIGAGTGKFTVTLAERGYSVFAVEPNADMRGQLKETLATFSNAMILDDTAEATTIPDHSVDVITVAHALHWFDLDAFREECRRIIKSDGLIIVIYNLTPGGEMISLSKQTTDTFFTKPDIMEFPNRMDCTRDSWLAYIASQDNYPLPGEPGYNEHITAINAIFDRDSLDGLLRCDRITRVYSEQIV
jgi:SAM-dependent methyltransferase